MKNEKMSIEKKIELFEKELGELLEKHNLDMTIMMDFPEYRILPEEIQLAIIVLNKHRMQYKISYKEKQ
jgi:hypothetical protein